MEAQRMKGFFVAVAGGRHCERSEAIQSRGAFARLFP